MEVLYELAHQGGIPLPAITSEDRQRFVEDWGIEDILTETAQFYHLSLTPEARDYLTKERGLTEGIISSFQIDYANGGLRKHLIDQCKLSLDLCLKAGVLKNLEEGVVKDYFCHRVILPNFKRGRVVHITARSLDGSEPKYSHLLGEIKYLFNEDALSSKEPLVVEGPFDCLSAVQAGYPTVAI